ncbi:MAG: hypothetical protein ACRDKL_11065, partial [Solirubrobacteraceae bacterium]
VVAGDPAAALRAAATLTASGRDPGQILRDLETHARELLSAQILGEVPPELRVTRDRDARLLKQAGTLAQTDAVRLLGLVSSALEACANGAQPRIQLELVLIKAAAPETDASVNALLARVARLERGGSPPPAAVTSAQVPVEVEPSPPPDAAVIPTEPGEEAVDLQQVLALWPAVVEMVRGANAMLAVLLDGARPTAVNERELVLSFPAEAEFYKRKAEQDEHRRATAEALRNVLGSALILRYELAEEGEVAGREPIAEPEPLSPDELVARLVEEFGAREIEDTDEEAES